MRYLLVVALLTLASLAVRAGPALRVTGPPRPPTTLPVSNVELPGETVAALLVAYADFGHRNACNGKRCALSELRNYHVTVKVVGRNVEVEFVGTEPISEQDHSGSYATIDYLIDLRTLVILRVRWEQD